jgi:glucuronate isomerase
LLPSDPAVRSIARRVYDAVRDLPVISPHGDVDPRLVRDDETFTDPVTLFVTPDQYVTRLLHADGVELAALGVAQGCSPTTRRGWCGVGCAIAGTCSRARRCATG